MHIFIDESGSFRPPMVKEPKAAAIGALIVPSAVLDDVLAEYAKLRRQFTGGDEELKGSKLTENQAARLISTLRRFDITFDACVIDIGSQSQAELTAFRMLQADKLIEHLTPEHHPTVVDQLNRLRDVTLRMPNQLFVQSFLTIVMVQRLLQTMTLYYVQRSPEELSKFHWRVDAKGDDVTPSEEWWTQLVLPVLQEESHTRPLIMLQGADYSHFERHRVALDPPHAGKFGTDLRSVLHADLQFPRSEEDLGVQIVDNLTAILTRALNNRLQHSGWNQLGHLMIRHRELSMHLVSLSLAPVPRPTRRTITTPFAGVIREVERRMKSMLVPDLRRA